MSEKTLPQKQERKSRKRKYSPPAVSQLTLDQAKDFVRERSNGNGEHAEDLLESLRCEQSEKSKQSRKTSSGA